MGVIEDRQRRVARWWKGRRGAKVAVDPLIYTRWRTPGDISVPSHMAMAGLPVALPDPRPRRLRSACVYARRGASQTREVRLHADAVTMCPP